MGDPAAKASESAANAAEELRYVLTVLERNPHDIYEDGRVALRECRSLLGFISTHLEEPYE